jgi:hypothetical protein
MVALMVFLLPIGIIYYFIWLIWQPEAPVSHQGLLKSKSPDQVGTSVETAFVSG